ncbi:ABC-type antimicrobial peptide transport system [Propionibacterium freudenreichii]|nr:ABC-type antimicrobial peptide transport system [Propionibacterium freudenreichii]SCQ78609.1 ABC-type antimicrobial peptide transport system [Propionibacterium freudenreichii]
MWKASWKSLMGHKVRLLLSALSVVLGIAFLSGALTFTGMLSNTFAAITQGTIADVSVGVKGTSNIDSVVTPDYTKNHLTNADIDRIRGVEGVQSASGQIAEANSVYLLGTNNKVVGMAGPPSIASNFSTEPAMNHKTGIEVRSGQAPTTDDEVAVDPSSLERSGYHLGDTVKLLANGQTITKKLVGTAAWGSGGTAGAAYVFFDDATASQLLMDGAPGYMQAAVTVAPGHNVDTVTTAVGKVVPQGFEAIAGHQVADQLKTALDQAMDFVNIFLGVFAAISLVVACFLIVNTFSMLVAQRSRELALYRALGASRRQVARSVIFEALLTGLFGGVVGVALGALLAFGIGRVVAAMGMDMGSAVPMPSWQNALLSVVIAVVVTVVAAWFPSRRASRVPPIAAMTGEVASGQGGLGRRTLFGTIMLVLGIAGVYAGVTLKVSGNMWMLGIGAFLVLIAVTLMSPVIGRPLIWVMGRAYRLLFGETGKLAELNAIRLPRRTAATASALMIGITLVSTLSILGASASTSTEQSVRETLRGDFVVTSLNYGPLPTTLYDQVKATQGVASVHRMRVAPTTVNGSRASVLGYPAADFNKIQAQSMVTGTMGDALGEVIVSQAYADAQKLQVGSTLESVDAATMAPLKLTVTGIFTTPKGGGFGSINANLATVAALGNRDRDSQLSVDAAPGASHQSVQNALDSATSDNPLIVVQNQQEYAKAQSAQIDQMLTTVYALLGLAVVIAVLGIVNTLALSVVERTREIGLLRAVGMKRGQLRLMITLESVIIAVLGAVLGLVMGLGFGVALQHVLVDRGLSILSIPWGRLGIFLAVSVVVGVLAAVVPARRATKLNMLDAISSE